MWWLIIPAATVLGGMAVRKAAQRVRESRDQRESAEAAALTGATPPPAPAVGPAAAPAPVEPAPSPAAPTVASSAVAEPSRQLLVGDFAERWVGPVVQDAPVVTRPRAPKRPEQPIQLAGTADLVFSTCMSLLFLVSMFWDIEGGLLRTIAVSGLIGWGTNWLAITMLFRPLERRPLLGQGLIPRKRREFFGKISQAVVENLISEEILHQEIERSGLVRRAAREQITSLHEVLKSPEFRRDFHDLVLTYVHRLVHSPEFRGRVRGVVEYRLQQGLDSWTGQDMKGKVVEAFKPLWKDQVRDEVLRNLEAVLNEIPAAVPHFLGKLDEAVEQMPDYLNRQEPAIINVLTRAVTGFVRNLNVNEIIQKRLGSLSNEYLERTVRNTTSRQLDFITLAGGILGALGGLVIWNPWFSLVLPVVALLVWALDTVMLRQGWCAPADEPEATPLVGQAAPAAPAPAVTAPAVTPATASVAAPDPAPPASGSNPG